MTKRTVLALGLAASALVLASWFIARPAYRRHQQTRAIAQAKKFIAEKDFRNASLSARRALAINPANLEACRIMALLAEIAGAPEALAWCQRIAELSPTVENKLALASMALRVQPPPFPLTSQTLGELAISAKDKPAYHLIAAELALKLRQPQKAEACFLAASQLEPTNLLHHLNIAVLRLQSTNRAAATEARATLQNLRTNSNLAATALRWLAADALAHQQLEAARDFSLSLLADPQSTMEDRLQHLEILRQTRSPDFAQALAETQTLATTNSSTVYSLSSWMVARELAPQAMQWLTNCPEKIQAERPVAMAKTDCLIAAKDWDGITSLIETQKWAEFDFMRLAFLSRAAGERKDNQGADGYWRLAVQQAGDRLGPLTSLAAMAGGWGRETAREDVLWRIAQKAPSERWTYRELEQLYMKGGNTRGLNRVYSAIVASDPKDFMAQNNLAATALLMGLNLPKAHEAASELYRQHPQEPIIVSTYALSLYLQGRTADGLTALERLKPEALKDPSIALYYAVLLRAQGQRDKAAPYAALAQHGPLLPEEKNLIAQLSKNE